MKYLRGSAIALFLAAFAYSPSCGARQPVWARKGVNFPARCFSDALTDCKSLRIFSPDHRSLLQVTYQRVPLDGGDYIMGVVLQVSAKDGTKYDIGSRGSVEQEVQWSPDSTSFFINGSDGGEGPEYVTVYRLGNTNGAPLNVIAAQRDMVKSFPPCKAKDTEPEACAELAEHPEEINVDAVDWTQGSSAIVVVAEMPCSSRYGGIMCEVLGYEVDVSTGKIFRRMEAREFAQRWQRSMAWKFHVPDPPVYETKAPSTPD